MQPAIVVKHLSYQYDEGPQVLNDVSFTIEHGEWISIVGHNGSGKSTLLKLMGAIIPVTDGEVHIDGIRVTEDTFSDVHEKVGIVFQNPDNQFVGATVEDDVAFGLENYGISYDEMHRSVLDALNDVDMGAYLTHEPHHLSGGQKQRVAIAGVIALSPNIIILDEATSMLDPEGRIEILDVIRKLQREKHLTVIHITHHLEETLESNRIFVMNKGELILCGTPEEIYTHSETLITIGLDLPFEMKLNRLIFNEDAFVTEMELLNKL
ncbi:energy-coupling factor transporter ATPase [Macrococcoides canis]|uniref:Energy-coupling factor transporter ATP-binding protein EcfA1 n=1 Tax=Macrococcoides canis TaxID=1855823 RepID=A0A1W7A8S4_9STAP|nr:energy-coupling factor transporter ATPase [Macrococcus canis]ARQ06017.1 Energy-coupling factor transporter ATP-binding protein EcfA1 [Macrococcus canis]UJS28100.1 energy-coupling factor transporter ATPase [Macrococcus canis]UTH00368.1 energy-coupling factor transporter ATPase [Macrococcus canis]UTH11849.1 energy-coupling factor transporter ATPase [Macrococcus canis]WBF52622.1 energy-coupling factor transporter ATPase [Macrococcus canis]